MGNVFCNLLVTTENILPPPGDWGGGGGGGSSFHDLYEEAPPKRGTFFRFLVNERVGISLVEIYEKVGKSVISVCKNAQKG